MLKSACGTTLLASTIDRGGDDPPLRRDQLPEGGVVLTNPGIETERPVEHHRSLQTLLQATGHCIPSQRTIAIAAQRVAHPTWQLGQCTVLFQQPTRRLTDPRHRVGRKFEATGLIKLLRRSLQPDHTLQPKVDLLHAQHLRSRAVTPRL